MEDNSVLKILCYYPEKKKKNRSILNIVYKTEIRYSFIGIGKKKKTKNTVSVLMIDISSNCGGATLSPL